MTVACLRCGSPADQRYRLVMGQGRLERLCPLCADTLSALVQLAGDACLLAVADPRFAAWLESGRWPTRDGGSIGPEDLPDGWHTTDCPCCAFLAEED